MSTRYRRNPQVEVAPMEDETILYHPAANRFCVLNRTAAVVWEGLEEPAGGSELTGLLRAHFVHQDGGAVGDEVNALLAQLVELDLVEVDGEHEGTGRRHAGEDAAAGAAYEAPSLRIMSEEEILKAFQVTSAGITWWVM